MEGIGVTRIERKKVCLQFIFQIFSINVLALGHDIRPCYKYYEMTTINNVVIYKVTKIYQRARSKCITTTEAIRHES